ncbi:hypothetical protein ACFQ0M_05395 [Kitasatospora aburaviensis]
MDRQVGPGRRRVRGDAHPSLAARAARPDVALVALHSEDTPVRLVQTATLRARSLPPATAAFLALLREAAGGARAATFDPRD